MLCWAVHLNEGPKRANHAAVALGHKVFSFGGFCTGETYMYDMDQIDVHIFNTVSLRWTKLPPAVTPRGEHPPEFPCPRHGHTAVLIDKIYIWGGLTDRFEYCNALFAFDVDTHGWFKPNVSGAVPEARYMHSACVVGKAMFIFGGFNWTRCTNDIYKLDTATMVWFLINPSGTPAPVLLRHSATVIGTKMFLFGGREDQMDQREDQYNNIRVFDTETNCWLSTPPAQLRPEGRMCHSAFTYNEELYIFGGNNCHLNRTVKFNDLWKFNARTFSWRKVEPKGKFPYLSMSRRSCCMVGDCVILFGGPDDLYILDLSPSLKTFCKLTVVQYGLEQSGLPHDIRWELATMTTNSNRKNNSPLKPYKKKK